MDSFLIYIKNKFNILVFEISVIIASPCILFFYILPNITSVSRGNTIAFVNAFSALTATSIVAFGICLFLLILDVVFWYQYKKKRIIVEMITVDGIPIVSNTPSNSKDILIYSLAAKKQKGRRKIFHIYDPDILFSLYEDKRMFIDKQLLVSYYKYSNIVVTLALVSDDKYQSD